MRLIYKIYFIIALFVVPMAGAIVYFVVTGNNANIEFANSERDGNQFQRPLESALDHVTQHQILAHFYLSGADKSVRKDMDDLKLAVDHDFSEIMDRQRELGERLKFNESDLHERERDKAYPARLQEEWNALVKDIEHLSVKDSNDRHSALVNNLSLAIAHSGDYSNLILDPELDTYYLTSATLLDLPGEHARLAGIDAFVLDVLQRKSITPQDRKQLAQFSAILTQVDRDNALAHIGIAVTQHVKYFGGLLPDFKQAMDQNTAAFNTSTTALAGMLDALADGEKVELSPKAYKDTALKALNDSMTLWRAAVGKLDGLLDRRIDVYASKRKFALGICGLLLIAAFVLSLLVMRTVTRSIEGVAKELHELSSGEANLTRRITVAGSFELQQLAQSFNTLMGKLLDLIKQIQQSGAQVASSSTQIAASTKELESAVTEQAASTNEIVATTKEISATSQTLVQTMTETGKVVSETAVLAGGAQTDLDGMESTMRQLADSTGSISAKLSAISDKANNINKIVSTITKVADQTNLLSLNASIEAEKAGEHGLGFSVVAREIRRLADQTAVATLDIERMVKEMQSAVSIGVMEMDKFTKDVGHGVAEVNQIGAQLQKIIEQVQAMAPRFDSVSEGMQAQSQGAQQISSVMVQLSDAARQTMDSLRQTNQAIMQLNSAARGLHVEISRFQTTSR